MKFDVQTKLRLTVNGKPAELTIDYDESLLSVLRNRLGLTGTKGACLQGECGACTVLVDQVPTNSCIALAMQACEKTVETIEAVSLTPTGELLSKAFLSEGACQCGYCIPGMLLASKPLVENKLPVDDAAIREALEGNLCRCTGYTAILKAISTVCSD
ncbi:MAG: (2Fe-2S)-binding protein [Planctomycetota bacterium]